MQDRMNTVEGLLLTDLNAESAITDEFLLIDDYLREPDIKLHKHELPALMFEALTCGPIHRDGTRESIGFVMLLIVENAVIETARSEIKRLLSLMRDFMISDQWQLANETQLGECGFDILEFENKGFRSVGILQFDVWAPLQEDDDL